MDEWDEVLTKVEQQFGKITAEHISDLIEQGVIPLITSIILKDKETG